MYGSKSDIYFLLMQDIAYITLWINEDNCIDDRADFNSDRRFYHWSSDFGEYLEGMADREPLVGLTTGAIYARLDHLRKKLRKIL